MKAQDFVRATTAYHDELNPQVWAGTEMQSEVRERLLGIAQLFIGFLEVENFVVEDIVLTGSLANYNYTGFSDFDLHVVTDYSVLQCDDIAEAFYKAKKTIWNDRHDIKIYNHEVELYVEDINEPPVSGGVFSVLHDKWLKTPNHNNPNINDTAIVRKVQELADQIERAIATADDPEDLKRLTEKLGNLRRSGLDAGGEFSVENLAFKTLRNMGMIKALHDAYTSKQDSMMSLREFANDDFDDRPKFIPWHDFIEGVKGIVGKEFEVVEKVVKSTIQARFVPIDAMEFGPTMLYSYYEARAGRNKGAISTRGAIQVGGYHPNSSQLGTRNYITSFNLLKGHPFERHFDLTPENISKIASIILGNTEGAYKVQAQQSQ